MSNKRYKLKPVDRLDNDGWEGLNEEATFYKNSLTNPTKGTHIIENNKGKAFINFSSETGKIKMLGSTGGGNGTEALIQALESIRDNNVNKTGATWETQSKEANDYYSHLELDKYITDNPFTTEYRIPKEKLEEEIKRLRDRNMKWITIGGKRIKIYDKNGY